MVFERSALGQQNRALFLGVDAIVYVEGGSTVDEDGNESFDALFWSKLFQVFKAGMRFRCIPKGSKDTILGLLRDAPTGPEATVFYAIDRDYDELTTGLLDNPRVLYTFGYSFENDIFAQKRLPDLFTSLCPVTGLDEAITLVVNGAIAEFVKDSWWISFADVAGVIATVAIIDRDRPQRYFGSAAGALPKISKNAVAAEVFRANMTNNRSRVTNVPLKSSMLPRLSVGHLYAAFSFKLLSHLHRLHSSTSKLTRDAVTASAILSFANHCFGPDTSEIKDHYASIFAALPAQT